jgi:predicted ester cyclase
MLAVILLSVGSTANSFSQEPRELLKKYIGEAINNRRVELLSEIFAENYELVTMTHDTAKQQTNVSNLRAFLTELFNAIPDLHYTIGDVFQEGDKGVIRVYLNGTHKGELFGHAATGNKISNLSEVFFCRVQNGRIVEFRTQVDWYHLYKHLQKQ